MTRDDRINADSLLKNMHGFKVDTIPGTKYAYSVIALSSAGIGSKPSEPVLIG